VAADRIIQAGGHGLQPLIQTGRIEAIIIAVKENTIYPSIKIIPPDLTAQISGGKNKIKTLRRRHVLRCHAV
jgi:hypothetical protein